MTPQRDLSRPLLMLAPVGIFLTVAAAMTVAPKPPTMGWLVPICFGAFASLILLWRSGAPVVVQSALSMLIVTELLMLGIRGDGLGMRNVETKVSSAIDSNDAAPTGNEAPSGSAPRVSIATTSSDADPAARELSRRIQQELPEHFPSDEIQGDLKVDRYGADTRLALSWSVGPAGSASWCGSTSVFAADTRAGIALLASQVARKLTTPRGGRGTCGA